MRPLLLCLLLASGVTCLAQPAPEASTPESRRLWRAMEVADIAAAGETVGDVLRDAELDLPDDLRWNTQRFDRPLNYYTPPGHVVTISHIPTEAQTLEYWRVWSALLTGSMWDPMEHFGGLTEAARMAAYNQVLLAAHELGHALAYRYTINPRTDDGNVNCQELLADRVATSVLAQIARGDARFEALHRDYLRLIGTLNDGVPEPLRYTMPSRDALLTDCRSIDVANPTDDPASLVPYASAFFERHRLLSDGDDIEPLADLARGLFRSQLRTLSRDEQATVALSDVQTQARLRKEPSSIWLGGPDLRESISITTLMLSTGLGAESGAYAIDPNGAPWLVSLRLLTNLFDTTLAQISTTRADDPDTPEALTPLALPLRHAASLAGIETALAFGDSLFIGLVQFTTTTEPYTGSYRLLGIARGETTWGPELELTPGDTHRLHHFGDRAVLATSTGLHIVDVNALALGRFNPDTSALLIDAYTPEFFYLFDASALGVQVFDGGAMTVEAGGSVLYRVRNADQSSGRVTGSGFSSTRDGRDPDRVAFQTILAARPLANGGLALIERLDVEGQAMPTNARSPAPAERGDVVLRMIRFLDESAE